MIKILIVNELPANQMFAGENKKIPEKTFTMNNSGFLLLLQRLVDNRVEANNGIGEVEVKALQAGQTDSLKEICHGKMLFSALMMMLGQRCWRCFSAFPTVEERIGAVGELSE